MGVNIASLVERLVQMNTSVNKELFTLCDLRLPFAFAYNGLYRSW